MTNDYPRKNLLEYQRKHSTEPAVVTEIEYELDTKDISLANHHIGFKAFESLSFHLSIKYDNTLIVSLTIPERPFIEHSLSKAILTSDVRDAALKAQSIFNLISILENLSLNAEEEFKVSIKSKFEKCQWREGSYLLTPAFSI